MTTRGDFEDSDRHCPRDGKRMIVEVGQDDGHGHVVTSHHCLHCDYSEHDGAWLTKSGTGGPRVTVGRNLRRRGYLGS